jgi:putative ABC transport system substrate-binding protein
MISRRRLFVALGAVALCAASLAAEAQQASRVYRVAVVGTGPAAAQAGPVPTSVSMRALVEALKARGYIEGQNLILERRSTYGLDDAGMDGVYADLARVKPDVIVVPGSNHALRAVKAASGIPIVMAASGDPVGLGLAQSLAHPGGDVTGLVTDVGAGAEEKRLEILLEMLPKARRIAFVGRKGDWDFLWGKAVRSAAAKRKVSITFAEGNPAGFAEALDVVKRRKSDAFFVALSPTTFPFSSVFGEFTVANRIPSSCGLADMAQDGCLIAYGQSIADIWTHSVTYVDKILKGAKPGDLPIEQPTRFQLVINLKTAKALGIKVPQSILVRADRVIE